MDTLLFYVKNGEKLELSIIIRSRTHSSLTLCSVSGSVKIYAQKDLQARLNKVSRQ